MGSFKHLKIFMMVAGLFSYQTTYAFDMISWLQHLFENMKFIVIHEDGKIEIIQPPEQQQDDDDADADDSAPTDDNSVDDSNQQSGNDDDHNDDEENEPFEATVSSFNYNGSKCPQNIDFALGKKGRSLVFWFDEIWAESGQGLPLSSSRANCQLTLSIENNANKQYALRRVKSSGYADLETGITATVKSTVYFQGGNASASQSQSFQGPYTDYYNQTGEFDQLIFSPCHAPRALNINTQVRTTRATDYSQITLENQLQFELVWRDCL